MITRLILALFLLSQIGINVLLWRENNAHQERLQVIEAKEFKWTVKYSMLGTIPEDEYVLVHMGQTLDDRGIKYYIPFYIVEDDLPQFLENIVQDMIRAEYETRQ